MVLLLLIAYVILFISTIVESVAIGWLLLLSVVLTGYCLIVMCSKTEKLTNIGKWILVFAVVGLIYSIMTITGFDVKSLF